jgi:hypothetical protein
MENEVPSVPLNFWVDFLVDNHAVHGSTAAMWRARTTRSQNCVTEISADIRHICQERNRAGQSLSDCFLIEYAFFSTVAAVIQTAAENFFINVFLFLIVT